MKARTQSNLILLTLVFLVFVTVGDRFLPKPLNQASLQTRVTLNNALKGLFPTWKPKNNPYQRTEDAIEKETQ